jgi:CubicO group peptidase (beta-lactamase class C family)
MAQRTWILGLSLTALVAAGGAGFAAQEAMHAWDWKVSTPDEQGLDGKALAELADQIRTGEVCPNLHALLVVRHGVLVLEEYFNGWKRDELHTLQSVSKSFTSALVGIAIARGEFKGVDEKVLDFFPDMRDIANMDERKASMRLKDLLTMRSGTDYHEEGPDSPHAQLNKLGRGWDKFYLDRPMVQAPGTGFQYDSGGVILISAMLKNRTGLHAMKYAERHLFGLLGIETYFWWANAEGHSHAGGGLNLTARDTAKLGQLYLNNGCWGDKQVVPEEWVRESCSMHVDLTGPGQPPSGYGYLWWIGAPDPRGNGRQYISIARGRFGQFIFIAPEHDIVVVILSVPREGDNPCNYMSLFYDRILAAVGR